VLFRSVLRGIGRLREPARVRAWLFGIARRAVMDRLRSQYARPALDEDADLEALAACETTDDSDSALEILHHELGRLPLLEREALTLFYLRELRLAEIAELLAVPIGTVKSRLFRGRRMLRHQLQAEGVSS
jgi:RNA polymerase sigma-70 factor (ECF subfamily)